MRKHGQFNSASQAHGVWTPGVVLMRNLKFGAKAFVISLAFLIPLLALIIWLEVHEDSRRLEDRQNATRQHVEVAHGVLVWAHEQETAGKLTRPQAQDLAKGIISKMRYDKSEYFWINDMHPTVLMHPINEKLNNKDVSDLKDPTGFALFKGFVAEVQKNGKGFVPYLWPKPGSPDPVEKLSYVSGFAPWGWVVGSGIYIDDLRIAPQPKPDFHSGGSGCVSVHIALLFCGLLPCQQRRLGHDQPAPAGNG